MSEFCSSLELPPVTSRILKEIYLFFKDVAKFTTEGNATEDKKTDPDFDKVKLNAYHLRRLPIETLKNSHSPTLVVNFHNLFHTTDELTSNLYLYKITPFNFTEKRRKKKKGKTSKIFCTVERKNLRRFSGLLIFVKSGERRFIVLTVAAWETTISIRSPFLVLARSIESRPRTVEVMTVSKFSAPPRGAGITWNTVPPLPIYRGFEFRRQRRRRDWYPRIHQRG